MWSVPNRTGLSSFLVAAEVENFDVFTSRSVEQRMVFRPSFDGSGFAPEGTDVDFIGGADFQ